MYYDKIHHHHSQVLAATGLTPVEFDALLVTFKYHWDGFIGHRPDGVEICMPRKKPKGKELTAVEKQENKRISGIWIKVEHAIGGMKKSRIVKERFRCHKFGFENMVILIACGLHNFRISLKMSYVTN